MDTLLDKAKDISGVRIYQKYTKEELDLSIAFFRGEINSKQGKAVLKKNHTATFNAKMASILRAAIVRGDVSIDLIKHNNK